MPIKLSAAAAISMCDALVDSIDDGVSFGQIVVYDGAQPATPDTAVDTQVALVTFDLPEPAFGAAVDGVSGATATGEAIDPVPADASGTATWFRILDGDGAAVFDGDVTDIAGSGSLKVSSTTIVSGIDVSVVSATITVPKATA